MYTPAAEIEEYLRDAPRQAASSCASTRTRWATPSARVHKYIDLAYREPLFQGGFIWDFADQAIALTDRHGREYFGYGGDFGDAPHDGDFSGNGIFFADHTPTPKLQEVRVPLPGAAGITVERRRGHGREPSARHLVVGVRVRRDARPGGPGAAQEEVLETDVAPGSVAGLPAPVRGAGRAGRVHGRRVLPAASATRAGRRPGTRSPASSGVVGSRARRRPASGRRAGAHPRHPQRRACAGRHFTRAVLAAARRAGLVPLRADARTAAASCCAAMPQPNFWHAPTSNERGWGGAVRGRRSGCSPAGTRRPCRAARPARGVEPTTTAVTVALPLRAAHRDRRATCDVAYRVDGDGRVEVTLTVRPGDGAAGPARVRHAADDRRRRSAACAGTATGPRSATSTAAPAPGWACTRRDVATRSSRPYLRPQEAGSRTGVRWASVTDDARRGPAVRVATSGMEFSALPWTPVRDRERRAPHRAAADPPDGAAPGAHAARRRRRRLLGCADACRVPAAHERRRSSSASDSRGV